MSEVPRLLFVLNSLGAGGAEKQVLTLLAHLERGRFALHLAYLKREEALLGQLPRAALSSVECCGVAGYLEYRGVRCLRERIKAERIDALVCTNLYSTLYGSLARAGLGARAPQLISVFHSTRLLTLKERVRMLAYRPMLARCDRLIYVCQAQRAYWRARGVRARTDSVVYNGIDAEHFADRHTPAQAQALRRALGFDAGDYVIGICSGLRPEKAHPDLLHALARLRSQGVPAKALLIGEGPERERIEREAGRLGLAAHLRITGFEPDVRPFIAASDVMCLVSHSETFSLAALEAMAMGKPLVMSDVGGAREQVTEGEQGLLFAPGDIDALTTRLLALRGRAVRARMGAAGARRVRREFTVQAMTSRFAREVLEVLESAGRGSGRRVPVSSAY